MARGVKEPWKFTSVERDIMKAAAQRLVVEFEREEDGGRPTVSGDFIANLWLESIEGAEVDTFGISLKGLKIVGPINLGGAKFSNRGRESLVGFMAEDCEFEGGLRLNNSRVESLYLNNCEFPDTRVDKTDPNRFSVPISMHGIEICGTVEMNACNIEGAFWAQRCRIHGRFFAANCTFSRGISLWGGHVDSAVHLSDCDIGNGELEMALALPNATVGGQLNIASCKLDGQVYAANLIAKEVYFQRVRFSRRPDAGLQLNQCDVSGVIQVNAMRPSGHLVIVNSRVGGDIQIFNSVTSGSFQLNNNRVSGSLVIHRSKSGARQLLALTCEGSSFYSVTITESSFVGQTKLHAARTEASFALKDTKFGRRLRDISPLEYGDYWIDASGLQIGHSLLIERCRFNSSSWFNNSLVNSGIHIRNCFFNGDTARFSVRLDSVRVLGLTVIEESLFTAGIQMPLLETAELQIKGNIVLAGNRSPATYPHAIWASDCKIGRRIIFGDSKISGVRDRQSVSTGTVSFHSTVCTENVAVTNATFYPAPETLKEGRADTLCLSRMTIGGDVIIAKSHENTGENTSPVQIHGCLSLEDAKISGDVLVDKLDQLPIGKITRPRAHLETEQRVSLKKRGVAVSFKGACIDGDLAIAAPEISGIVDLRDARIDRIADGGGQRWSKIGLQPGHLLLDGLTYRDLDNVTDDAHTPDGMRLAHEDAVSKRLAWLALQFPDRKPSLDTFVPQPYEQLAKIFAAEGNERARRKVQIARRDLQRKHGGLKAFERWVQQMLKWVSEYGYSPGRAISASLIYLGFGALVAAWMDGVDALMLADSDTVKATLFNPLVFALDAAIPIIDLNQDGIWAINPEAFRYGWTAQAMIIFKSLYEVFGMLLVSITVLTLTGTLRERE